MLKDLFKRLLDEELGQDVIEYALLSGLIATVGVLTWQNIGDQLGTKYVQWDGGVQGLWEPDDPLPAGGGS